MFYQIVDLFMSLVNKAKKLDYMYIHVFASSVTISLLFRNEENTYKPFTK